MKRPGRKGPRWSVKYRAGGRVRWEKCASYEAAVARRAEVELEQAHSGGTWEPPARVTLSDAAEAWYERRAQALRPQTLANHRSALDVHILPALGHRPTASVRPSDVEALRASLAARGYGANTISNIVGVLRQVLAELVADRQLPSNPAAAELRPRGKRPGQAPRRIVVPSHEEVDKLLAAASPAARPALELAAATGLRRSELLALTWADVDFEARELHVRAAKTAAGERAVPLFGSARRLLLEVKAASPYKRPDDLVFPTIDGTPESPAGWARREYLGARERAGLRDTLRLHDLRHYAVSRLIEQGANILLVSKIAGHARASVTLDVYSHLFREGLADAAEQFDPLARHPRAADSKGRAGQR
ncbi:MAG: tyrosine-type recombinase/integrase [Candidatus Limnocylindria bacterium]